MFRFISFIFGWEEFEPCKSCQTLKEMLEFERLKNQELTETLLKIVKPEAVVADRVNVPENSQILQGAQTFSRRRAALELKDRIEAQIKAQSTLAAKPDSEVKTIEELEQELKITSERESNG